LEPIYDVVVAGAGNAALCAALAAREGGARVLVLERAPRDLRGGNTYFTGAAFRFPYDGLDDIRRLVPDLTEAEAEAVDVGAYSASQMRDDLSRVSDGHADAELAGVLVDQAYRTIVWMRGKAFAGCSYTDGKRSKWMGNGGSGEVSLSRRWAAVLGYQTGCSSWLSRLASRCGTDLERVGC